MSVLSASSERQNESLLPSVNVDSQVLLVDAFIAVLEAHRDLLRQTGQSGDTTRLQGLVETLMQPQPASRQPKTAVAEPEFRQRITTRRNDALTGATLVSPQWQARSEKRLALPKGQPAPPRTTPRPGQAADPAATVPRHSLLNLPSELRGEGRANSDKHPRKGKWLIAGLAALATGTSAVVVASPERTTSVTPGQCETSEDKKVVEIGVTSGPDPAWQDRLLGLVNMIGVGEDSRRWGSLAEAVSKEFGYYISPHRLAAANKTAMSMKDGHPMQLAEYDEHQQLDELVRVVGPYCITIPRPIIAGQVETSEDDTVKKLAETNMVDVAVLRKLNPGLPRDDEKLEPGKIVRIADKTDPSLILQKVQGREFGDFVDPKDKNAAKQITDILTANGALLAQEGDPDMGYFPLRQTEPLKKRSITPEMLAAKPATPDYQKKTEAKKEAPDEPKEQKTLSLEERKKLIEGLDLDVAKKAQLVKFVETIDVLQKSGAGKDVALPVMLAQAVKASDWGQSVLAREHNNIFAIPAKGDWKGQVAWVVPEGSNVRVKYRKYDSMQQAFEDYIRLAKASPGFTPHQAANGYDDEAMLAGLYGRDNPGIVTELVYKYFTTKKLTENQIAAMVGNMRQESGLNPKSIENVSEETLRAKGRTGPAQGLIQWQEGRLKDLKEFAKQRGKAWDDPALQLEFIWKEFQGKESKAFKLFTATGTLEDAVAAFCNGYERAGVPHMENRIKYANQAAASHARNQKDQKALLELMNKYSLTKLASELVPAPSATEKAAPTPAITIPPAQGPFKLDPSRYVKREQHPLISGGAGSRLDADNNPANGSETRSSSLGAVKGIESQGYKNRLAIVQRELNEAHTHVSPEGFQQFRIHDVSAEVRKRFARNYVGSKNGQGSPKSPRDIKYFIFHFTSTPSSANNYGGVKQAGTMYYDGKGYGINYGINQDAEVSFFTGDFTVHTKGFRGVTYNGHAYGVEIAASEQAEVNSKQYEAAIYLAARFLIDHGFIQKGQPVSPTIKKMIMGHREANAAQGMHSDMPALVMDPIRAMLTDLLVEMGYTR